VVAVDVPMTFPLGTSAGVVGSAPLLLIDLETLEGITGRTYLFGYRPSGLRAMAAMIEDATDLIMGQRVSPLENVRMLMRGFDLIGVTGSVRMALSAIDAALWDAAALAAGLPLAVMLGSSRRKVPAYNSSGLGLMSPGAAAVERLRLG
jgi:mandelate racemase